MCIRDRAGALLSKLATRERLVFIAPSCGRTGWYADSPYSVSYTHLDVYKRQCRGSGSVPGAYSEMSRPRWMIDRRSPSFSLG